MPCEVCGCPEVRWLRVTTVAEQFKCNTKLVRRLMREGKLDGLRFGFGWRVDHQSLDEYVRKVSVRFAEPVEDPPWCL